MGLPDAVCLWVHTVGYHRLYNRKTKLMETIREYVDRKARELGYSDAFDYFCFGDPGMFNVNVILWMEELVAPRDTLTKKDIEEIVVKQYPVISPLYHAAMAGARAVLIKLKLLRP